MPLINEQRVEMKVQNSEKVYKPQILTATSAFYAPGKKSYMPVTDQAFVKIEKPLFSAIKTGGFNLNFKG